MGITVEKVKEKLLEAIEVNDISKKDLARLLDVNYNTFLLHLGEGSPTVHELLGMCQLFSLTEDDFYKDEPIKPVPFLSILTMKDIANINKVIQKIEVLLKNPNSPIQFKKHLAEKLGMDYRKLINKLNISTLKADEFLNIIALLDGKISMFVPNTRVKEKLIENGLYVDDDSKVDFQTIYVDSRENIGVHDMHKYVNGGVVVDSLKRNGVELYFPYGIFVDYFKAVENAVDTMKLSVNSMETEYTKYVQSLKDHEMDMHKRMNCLKIVDILQTSMTKLKNDIAILEMVSPIVNEV